MWLSLPICLWTRAKALPKGGWHKIWDPGKVQWPSHLKHCGSRLAELSENHSGHCCDGQGCWQTDFGTTPDHHNGPCCRKRSQEPMEQWISNVQLMHYQPQLLNHPWVSFAPSSSCHPATQPRFGQPTNPWLLVHKTWQDRLPVHGPVQTLPCTPMEAALWKTGQGMQGQQWQNWIKHCGHLPSQAGYWARMQSR